MQGMHHDITIDPGLVRAKAYEIWQSLGCPEGAAEQTWFEAERQLRSHLAGSQREVAPHVANPASEPAPAARVSPDSEPPASDRFQNHDSVDASSRTKKIASGMKRTTRR